MEKITDDIPSLLITVAGVYHRYFCDFVNRNFSESQW